MAKALPQLIVPVPASKKVNLTSTSDRSCSFACSFNGKNVVCCYQLRHFSVRYDVVTVKSGFF